MFLHSIRPRGILSFGPETESIPLGPLNVLIGPNGSGKSNLIDVISILAAAPTGITAPMQMTGGLASWSWRMQKPAKIAVETSFAANAKDSYLLDLRGMAEPQIEDEFFGSTDGEDQYRNQEGAGFPQKSIFELRRDLKLFPNFTRVGIELSRIRIYRDWVFGSRSDARAQALRDERSDYVVPNGSNLANVIAKIKRERTHLSIFRDAIKDFIDGVEDIEVLPEGGALQVFLIENGISIPATRLSDGTLRYLYLLAILLTPGLPLICIEEPELGLHPDVLPKLAKLMVEASKHTQLIITTHSDILVDALSETPDCIRVCEKREGGTQIRQVDQTELKNWLNDYSLGEIWRRGFIGGNPW